MKRSGLYLTKNLLPTRKTLIIKRFNNFIHVFLQTLNTSLPMIINSQDSTTKSITKLYSTEHLPSI